MINCVYDWTNWTSQTAQYFQTCAQSSKTDVTALTIAWQDTKWYQIGGLDTVTSTGTSCKPGKAFWWPIFPVGHALNKVLDNGMAYIFEELGVLSHDEF